MDNGASQLAIAILVLVAAFILYFFAFHPNGVANVSNPVDALKFLMAEFNTAGTTAEPSNPSGTSGEFFPTPTGNPPPNTLPGITAP